MPDPAPSGKTGGGCVRRVDLQCPTEQCDGLVHAFGSEFVKVRERAKIQIIGIETFRGLARRALDFGMTEFGLDRADDAARYPVLLFEDVVKRVFEAVGPDMGAAGRVDQLAGNAHTVARFTHAAFEHIAHTKLAADLTQIRGFALVGEA